MAKQFTREKLLSISLSDLLDEFLEMQNDYLIAKRRITELEQKMPSDEVKETNKKLRKENAKLTSKLEKIKRACLANNVEDE